MYADIGVSLTKNRDNGTHKCGPRKLIAAARLRRADRDDSFRKHGEPVVVILQRNVGGWTPMSFVRSEVIEGRIERVADYTHGPLILAAATSVVAEP